MTKYRAKNDYAALYAGDHHGFATGLEGFIFLRKETTQRSFLAPRIGTQGKSTSASTPSTDISAGTDTSFKIALRGATAITVALTVAGLNTGTLIAAAIESTTNTALAAAGSDHRIWCEFTGGLYVIHDQETGTASTVVITNAASNNVADDLKIGVANAGVEVAGTDDSDFLLMTTGGLKFSQPIESNQHRSGRFHTGIVRKKKVAEFDFDTYVNMLGTAGASIDTSVQTLWENAFGQKVVNSGVSIDFNVTRPNFTMSMVKVGTVFAEYYTGGYVKGCSLKFPGNGPATVKWTGKAAQASASGLAQINGVVTASSTVVLQTGEASHYTDPQYDRDGTTVVSAPLVMVIDPDGRTILAGADGTLSILSLNRGTDNLVLSAAVSVGSLGFLVPWDPGAVQKTGTDQIYTDLHGSFQFDTGAAMVDVTEVTFDFANNTNDLDDRFGRDANVGAIYGQRADPKLSVKFDLSAGETLGQVLQARAFNSTAPKIILGDGNTARKLVITAPKWIPNVPPIDLPQNGPVPVTMEGMLYQSGPGAQDPVKVSFQ